MKKISVECYTRIVGYFRPANQSNVGKQEEIRERKNINIKKAIDKIKLDKQ